MAGEGVHLWWVVLPKMETESSFMFGKREEAVVAEVGCCARVSREVPVTVVVVAADVGVDIYDFIGSSSSRKLISSSY